MEFLGTRLHIDGPDRWLSLARELWTPFVMDDDDEVGETLVVRLESRGWSYQFPNEDKVEGLGPWSSFIRVRAEVGPWALKRNTDLFALHGALVVREGTSILLTGEGGSGKSSSSLMLCSQGWSFGGDDFAPMSLSSGMITPFPAPAALVDPVLAKRLSRGWVPPAWAEMDDLVAFLVPPSAMTLASQPTLPSLLLFVRFSTRSPSGISRISKGQALSEIAREALNLTPQAMSVISRLVESSPALSLTFSDLAEVPALVDAALTNAG